MLEVKKWIRRGLISIPILVILTMVLQIWSVPDYRYGESFVSYSPDGKYRVDHVFPQHSHTDIRIFTNISNKNVVALVPTPSWFEVSVNPLWVCNDDRSECYEHILQTHDGVPVNLPPSLWQRLHAWLTIEFKDLENPQLKIYEISTRYPPVNK